MERKAFGEPSDQAMRRCRIAGLQALQALHGCRASRIGEGGVRSNLTLLSRVLLCGHEKEAGSQAFEADSNFDVDLVTG